jgi:hypothetical protein
MNTCDTCKHWKRPDRSGFVDHDMIDCARSGYGLCAQPGEYAADQAPADGIYVAAGDFAASSGHLETGPKFGCVHHEHSS